MSFTALSDLAGLSALMIENESLFNIMDFFFFFESHNATRIIGR